MKHLLKNLMSFFLGKKIGQRFFKFLHLLSLKGMNFGGGSNPKESGESFVIEYALKKNAVSQPTVLDAGANLGEYTKLWLEKKPNSIIHIFEPSAFLAQKLKNIFQNENVQIHQVALGETAGESVFFADQSGSGLGSLLKRNIAHAGIIMKEQEKVRVENLDSFCQQHKLANIDFLKLDIEGYEFFALKGAAELLKNKRIKFIQFEFGGTDIDARVFFKDFYLLLSGNYKIFRILKNGLLEIKNYTELDEVFLTTNYLAEAKD